jgi:hypothetical protein
MVSQRGQTAIVLILMIAIALVMYSASLNWSRLAQFKALTTVGSNSAAAEMASMMASYGEQQLQVQLGGQREICKKTNFFVLLITVIVAIIVTYLCWGSCIAGTVAMVAAVVGVVLAVAALVINVTVVEPGLTRLWNKLQGKMKLESQVIEGAVLTGVRSSITDSDQLYDHFDMDVDGQWVDDLGVGNIASRKDKFSRFAYYYTRRLQEYAPQQYPEIKAFSIALRELMYDNPYGKIGPPPGGCTIAEQTAGDIKCQNPDNFGIFDPGCTGTVPLPYCDPCCQPEFQQDGVTPLRPETCTVGQVAACAVSGDYPVANYPDQYDPFLENYTNAFHSFREMLGIDDENEGYNRNPANPNSPPPQNVAGAPNNVFRKEDTTGYWTAAMQASQAIIGGTPDNRTGVLPFFWGMSLLMPVQAINVIPPPVIPTILKSDSVIMMTANPATCTVLDCTDNKFVVHPDQCGQTEGWDVGTSRPKTDGFYWKPGSDEYCSNVFPYNDCIGYTGNCADGNYGGAIPDCGCPAAGADTVKWHDDNLDNLIYGLKQFSIWAMDFLSKNIDDLNKDFDTWYPEAAIWIAPKCTGAPNSWCYDGPNDGQLIIWRDMLGSWVDLIDDWLYRTTFADDNSWCLPTAPTAAATFLPVENNVIPSLNPASPIPTDKDGNNIPLIWGDLNDTVACLNYNANNLAKLTACQANCTVNPTDYSGNANLCLNLPRTALDVTPPSSLKNSGSPAENAAYAIAQQLQNCLGSTCQDGFGVPLPVCVGLPIAQPVDCVAFAPGNAFYDAIKTERDNQFDISNFCEPAVGPTTNFQVNLGIAISAATAQGPSLTARSAELTALRDGALNARNTFLSGYRNFSAFLAPCAAGLQLGDGCADCSAGGPVANLICAKQRAATVEDGLPNFVIYGWQSKPVSGRGAEGTDPEVGYWHIVRSEAFAPQRCYQQCGTNRLPWVKTRTFHRGLNRIRCYTLTDTDGVVISRVTRYDEDHDSPGAKLANGQALWRFRFTNPGVASSTVPGSILATDCKHPLSYETGLSPESKIALDGAFMINNNPLKDPVRVNATCFDTVNALLDRGVQTTTCARYYYDPSINHMSLKFTPCNAAAVATVTGCAQTGLCPN